MKKRKNNNGVFYVVISLALVLGVASIAVAYSMSQNVNVQGDYNYYEAEGQLAPEEISIGGFPGGDIYNPLNVNSTFSYGGGAYIATSTETSTYTVVQADLQPYSYIDLMVNLAATTFTLPATSTMDVLLPYIGATREWLIHNATSSSGITLTLAAGGGMDLVAVTANDDVIDPGEWTRLTCTRIYYRSDDNENIMCIVDELANAD